MLVDDEPIMRRGLYTAIKEMNRFKICCEANNVNDALNSVKEYRPDIIIVDIAIEGDRGIEFINFINQEDKTILILVFTRREESIYAERCLHAGAKGFLSKKEPIDTLVSALMTITQGKLYLSSTVSERVLLRIIKNDSSHVRASDIEQLSNRELEILHLLGQGKTTGEIAEELNICMKTVQSHFSCLKKKLNVKNFNQLICRAVYWVLEGQ